MSHRETSADQLFEVRNAYYLGEYQKCINEAQKAKVSAADLKMGRDIFMYRAYIGLEKYKLVLDELRNTQTEELKGLQLLAEYLHLRQGASIDENKRAIVLKELDERLASGAVSSDNYAFFVAAATIYCFEENYEAALRVLHQSDHLECLACTVFTYCKMDRADCAKKVVKRMQEMEEDATLTQLAEATVNLQMNGEHVQEAYHILHDLSDKYAASSITLNGMVTALICMGRWDEAEGYLQEALQKLNARPFVDRVMNSFFDWDASGVNADPHNASILANLVVCSGHTGKSDEVINRYVNQLRDSHPSHPMILLFASKEREFERIARQYAPEVASA